MKRSAVVLAFILLVSALACWRFLARFACAAGPVAVLVEGTVVDADGKPLAGATVLLVPDKGGKPQTLKTGKGGDYSFKVQAGLSIDILYWHPDAGAAQVSLLSGQNDQKIHKVLFQSTQVTAMSDLDINAELASYQRLGMQMSIREDVASLVKDEIDPDLSTAVGTRIHKLSDRIKELEDTKATKEASYLKSQVISAETRLHIKR